MQDLSTGEIKELDPAFFKGVEEFHPMLPASSGFSELAQLRQREAALQSAADAVIPVRENQGPVFAIGEEVTVKGGRFVISGITSKRIYLDSIPSK